MLHPIPACTALLAKLEDIAMINDPWLKTSIMAKRGLAKGEAGQAPRTLDRSAGRVSTTSMDPMPSRC